jgi:hypothetical protein
MTDYFLPGQTLHKKKADWTGELKRNHLPDSRDAA